MFEVKKAKRQRRPLKIGLEGLSGSGKTFTGLRLAFAMRRAGIGKRIVVADSENESASLYDGIFIDGERWEYDVCSLPHEAQTPEGYTAAYEHLVGAGFDIIIVDSMTHAWKGALNRVDEIGARNKGDKFGSGWRAVTPEQERMFRVLTDPRAHLITTTRVKGEYERVNDGSRDKIKKVGMKADQRDGADYEYDCVVRLDPEGHLAVVEKVRGCSAMDAKQAKNPGPEFWKPLFDWWLSAEPTVSPAEAARAKIVAAKTLPELSAAWEPLSKSVREQVLADKDRRKAELTPAASPPPPPAPAGTPPAHNPAPATAAAPPTEAELARADTLETLQQLCGELSTTPAAMLAAHAAKVGPWVRGEALPPVERLTDQQLDALCGIVRALYEHEQGAAV